MQNTNTNTEDMVENGGYISKLFLNNGKEIDINKNDIVIFVGPNNAGKSQALKDIYEICDTKKPTIVVNMLVISKHFWKRFQQLMIMEHTKIMQG